MVLFAENGETFRVYKIFMRNMGIWPLDKDQRRSTIIFSVAVLAQMVIILASLIQPLQKCFSDEVHYSQALRNLSSTRGALNLINLRAFGRWMIPLMETTVQDWSLVADPKEREIMKRHNRSGTLYFCAQAIFVLVINVLCHLGSTPLIDGVFFPNKRQSCAFNDEFIWDHVIILLSVVVYFFANTVNFCAFLLFWSFAMHLSGQYKILKQHFHDFLLIRGKKATREEFRWLVERHNQLLDLSGCLEKSFTVCIAVNVFIMQIIICLMVFQEFAGFEGVHPIETIQRCRGVLLTATALYMYYYAGDYLTACSEEIGQVLTQCNWYELSKESITNFSIVIARCQIPRELTAVRMYKLNLMNLKHVVHAIYAYITCIVAVMKNKDK